MKRKKAQNGVIMNYINKEQSIGEIVTLVPKASEIFKEYRIDFCCGGHRPLSQAMTELNLNENEILRRLEDAYEELQKNPNDVDLKAISNTELIDSFIMPHHVFTKLILPEISELATKILRVHGSEHKELFQIHKLVRNLEMELEQHLIKEEEILFPMIKEYDKNPSSELLNNIKQQVEETEAEHEGAGDILKELRKLTGDYIAPADGCGTYRRTFAKLQELEADLFQHIHMENNILFTNLDIIVGV